MQKFVPRSCVGNFHNERIRSTPLHRKLTFWCVSFYLVAFGTVWLPYETRCKMGRTSAKVRATKLHRNFLHEHTQYTPLDPKLMFWCVSYYLGAFGTFGCVTKLGAKRAELVQKFVPRSRIGIFDNGCTQSTPLDPKLTFWCVSYYLGAFGTFGCHTKLGTKRAELVQKFVPRSRVGIFRNKSTRSNPLDPKLMFWCVSYYLGAFGTFGCVTKLGAKRAELVQKFVPRSHVRIFL